MSETRTFGYNTGATKAYVAFCAVFFALSYISYVITRKIIPASPTRNISINRNKLAIEKICKWSAFLVFSILIASSIITSLPIISGTDRIAFWATKAIPGQRIIFNQIPLLAFLAGLNFAIYSEKQKRNLSKVVLAMCIVMQITYGETFTAIATSIFFFSFPIISKKETLAIMLKNKTKILITVSAIFGTLAAYKFSGQYISGIGSSADVMINRVLALQGQVWWHIYSFNNQITDENYSGIQLLMYNIAPPDVFNAYNSNGINFTMGYPAILISEYRATALLPHAIISIAFGSIIALLHTTIKTKKIFSAIATLKLYSHYFVIITNGETQNLISAKSLIYIVIIAIFFTLESGKTIHHNIKN